MSLTLSILLKNQRNLMRRKIAAANWKMNLEFDQGLQLTRSISNELDTSSETQVILATPYLYLKSLADLTFPLNNLHIAAQNCHDQSNGAFTGEISIGMLQSINVNYVIIGHSERRLYNNETDSLLKKKVTALSEANMNTVFCCGESLEIREEGKEKDFVSNQLLNGLFHLSSEDFKRIIIAYEPIWAIGTGVTASKEQAQEMHAFIRSEIEKQYGSELASETSILYGGSVKPDNAIALFEQEDVDGGLVGGASLKADSFLKIIEALS